MKAASVVLTTSSDLINAWKVRDIDDDSIDAVALLLLNECSPADSEEADAVAVTGADLVGDGGGAALDGAGAAVDGGTIVDGSVVGGIAVGDGIPDVLGVLLIGHKSLDTHAAVGRHIVPVLPFPGRQGHCPPHGKGLLRFAMDVNGTKQSVEMLQMPHATVTTEPGNPLVLTVPSKRLQR